PHDFPSQGGTPYLRVRHDGTGFGAAVLRDGRIVVTTNRARSDQNHLLLVERDGSTKLLTPDTPSAMHHSAQALDDAIVVLSDRDRDLAAIARVGTDGSFRYVVAPAKGVVDQPAVARPLVAGAANGHRRA